MNCLEIQIKDKIFKLKNDNYTQSESYTDSDWAMVWNFITKGTLPNGWSMEGENSRAIFDQILNELKDYDSSTMLSGEEEDLINNIIGNHSFNEISEYYSDLPLGRDVLVMKSISGNNWYGINKNRVVLITGDTGWKFNKFNRIVYDTFNALKAEDKFVIDKINKLYSKYSSNDIDVFKKMMFLVNNYKEDFAKLFYNPYNSHVDINKKNIVKEFKKIKGLYTILKRENGKEKIFIFKNIGDTENDVEGILIDNESNEITKTSIKVSEIKSIYSPYKFGTYTLYHNTWLNSRLVRVDRNTADNLYREFLHADDDSYNMIDLSSEKILFKNIRDFLVESQYEILLHTDDGIYKNNNGDFLLDNEREITDNTRVYKISIHKNNSEIITKINSLLNKGPKFNLQNLRLYIYEKFGENVKIYTDFNRGTSIRVQANDTLEKKYTPVIIYGDGGINFDDDFYLKTLLAIEFSNYINENNNIASTFGRSVSSEFSNLVENFKKYKEGLDVEVSEAYISIFNKVLKEGSVFNENELEDIIENNKRSLFNDKEEQRISELTKQLIDLGLYIYSCSI